MPAKIQSTTRKGFKEGIAVQLLTSWITDWLLVYFDPLTGYTCCPSALMMVLYFQLSPEEASSGLLTIDCPGLDPKVLHVDGHSRKDGLARGKGYRNF